jgi:hypothetical protein
MKKENPSKEERAENRLEEEGQVLHNEFPLYKHIVPTFKPVYNIGTFTLEPLMRGIYKDWKNKIGWYDEVERVYKNNGKHPDWFQKLIDEDAQENTNEEKAGSPEENRKAEE